MTDGPSVHYPWQPEKPAEQDAWIMTQTQQPGGMQPPRDLTKWAIVAGVAVILLGGIGSIVFMIGQTTRSTASAIQRRSDEIASLLEEDTGSGGGFALVSQVQAYENPFEEETQYENPFDEYYNPFDE